MTARLSIMVGTAILGLLLIGGCDEGKTVLEPENPLDMPYSVFVDTADFVASGITGNTFFPINSGSTYVYEGLNEDDETVRVEEVFTHDTKVILGITCVVVNAREYEAGELIEDTFDWYAQDKQGNVWYFGEDSYEISNGTVVDSAGSWEAGVDGALPGIIMLANPIEGLWYRQEYYEGEAEDVAQVLSLSETLTVPYGTYTNCLQIAEWNPLEPGIVEHKYYAAGVGLLKAVAVKGESGYESLTEITTTE